MRRFRRERGFTLIEVLIVVAIIGILAGIAVWNYLIGLQKAKQKRTIADMKSIAQAWEARAGDMGGYSVAGAFVWPATAVTHASLLNALSPTYVRVVPKLDGWGKDFDLATATSGGEVNATTYAIRSAGRDGTFESSYPDGTTTSFDCDIVYSNGAFVVFPAESQRQ